MVQSVEVNYESLFSETLLPALAFPVASTPFHLRW